MSAANAVPSVWVIARDALFRTRWWIGLVWSCLVFALAVYAQNDAKDWIGYANLPFFAASLTWLIKLIPRDLNAAQDAIGSDASSWWRLPIANLICMAAVLTIPCAGLGLVVQLLAGGTIPLIARWLLVEQPIWLVNAWVMSVSKFGVSRWMPVSIVIGSCFAGSTLSNYGVKMDWIESQAIWMIWLVVVAAAGLLLYRSKGPSPTMMSALVWSSSAIVWIAPPRALESARPTAQPGAGSLTLWFDSVSVEREHLLRVAFHVNSKVGGDQLRLARSQDVYGSAERIWPVAEVVSLNAPSSLGKLVRESADEIEALDGSGSFTWSAKKANRGGGRTITQTALPMFSTDSSVRRANGVAVVLVYDDLPTSSDQISAGWAVDIASVDSVRRIPLKMESRRDAGAPSFLLKRGVHDDVRTWVLRRSNFSLMPLLRTQHIEADTSPSFRVQLKRAHGPSAEAPIKDRYSRSGWVLPTLLQRFDEWPIDIPANATQDDSLIVQSLSSARRFQVVAKSTPPVKSAVKP